MYEDILKILGGATILVAAVGWLIRSLILHFLSKDVEKFKEQLSSANALELEKLRSALARQTLEHEVKFRRLDEKIAEHLTVIYQRLFVFYEAVVKYVKIVEFRSEPSKDEKFDTVTEANREFWDYFLLNRVYVAPVMFKQIHSLASTLADISNDFNRGLEREKQGRRALNEDDEDHWIKALEGTKEKATPMFTELVAEVQRRLGVVDSQEQSV